MTAATTADAASHRAETWYDIDWQKVHRTVRRLQARIVQAVQAGRWSKAKALQRLLTHSFTAKALAVKRVTMTSVNTPSPAVQSATAATPPAPWLAAAR